MFSDKIELKEVNKANRWRATLSLWKFKTSVTKLTNTS